MAEEMTKEELEWWNKKIVRVADIDFSLEKIEAGEPPEETIRLAMVQLLIAIARQLQKADISQVDWFPMEFPMRLSLQCETFHYDFQVQARLMNRFGIEEEEDGRKDRRAKTD